MPPSQTFYAPSGNPIRCYTFDNVSGATVYDEMGNGNATIGDLSRSQISAGGVIGNYFENYYNTNYYRALDFADIPTWRSLSVWAKFPVVGTNKYDIAGTNAAFLGRLSTNAVVYANSGAALVTVTDTAWHHYLITFETGSNTNFKVFFDGALVATRTDGVRGSLSYLGGFVNVAQYYSASLDVAQIYDIELTANDAAALYAMQALTNSMLALLEQSYSLENWFLRAVVEQPFTVFIKCLGILSQPYGLRLLTALIQYYGDTPAVRRLLAQYYGSATMLRRILAEPYGDALAMRQIFDQEWTLPEALRRIMEQRYSIAGDELRAVMAENYAISEYELLRQQLDQVYVMGADGALSQRPAISVTADGVAIDPHHINIEVDEGEYAIRGEIHLARQDEYLRCHHLWTEIVITIEGDEYRLLVDSPRRSRPELGRAEYIVPCVSPTVLLDAPYAETITREFSGAMASAIVADLAASAGISVAWQCVDWYLPSATLYANAETPLSVIRKIVAAVGGIIQTTPAGILLCRPEYPVTVPGWATATPDHYLTDMDNYFSVDSSPVIRDGFNRFLISNQDAATAGLTIEQVDIDAMTKEIRVYQVPWNDASIINLRTSGGAWVSIIDDGVIPETITDLVEIVGGEGHTTKPIYNIQSHDYQEAVLGAVTPAEDGHLATEVKGNSLLEMIYSTRYHKFIVSDSRIEDVQFYPEEVLP